MFKTIHRLFYGLAWLMAIAGGIVLGLMVLMICLSIVGRSVSAFLHGDFMQSTMPGFAETLLNMGIGPIFGDYELIVGGMAFSIFAFISWCQITSGHATVDIFTSGLRDGTKRWLQMITEIVFAIVLILIALQLSEGMSTYMRRRSTTFLLQYPLWWNYAVALVPAVIAAIIGVYMAIVRTVEAVTGRELVISEGGADH